MPTTWTVENDKLMLLEMFRELGSPSLSKTQWDNIASRLPMDVTGSAVQQRFGKQVNKIVPVAGKTSTPSGSKNSTPRSNKRKADSRPAHFNNRNDDEDFKTVTPKRVKTAAQTSAEDPLKVEDADSEEDTYKTMFGKTEE